VEVIAAELNVADSQIAILSVSRRRLEEEERVEEGGEPAIPLLSLRRSGRKLQQRGQDASDSPIRRKLAGSANVRFQVSGYVSQAAASAALSSTASWLIDTSASGFAQVLKVAAPSLDITSTTVTSSTAQDNSLASSTASFQFSCSLSSVDTLYWTVADDSSYVTAMMLHKGSGTTKLDWVALGLVDADATQMVNSAVPNRVFLYRPNTVASEYLYQIDGYSPDAIVSSANAARSSIHQGVTAVQSIDNYVTMQAEFSTATGVSDDVELNLGQGRNNKLIFASGAEWPAMHTTSGFTTVSWADGVCKKVAKEPGFSNTIIWTFLAAIFLFNGKLSPFRNLLNDKIRFLSSLHKLHPTFLSRFVGDQAASWFMLDSSNAQTFTIPSVFALLVYFALNVVIYAKNMSSGLQFASGRVAVLNMWVALIPTTKNSTVLYLSGIPFERCVKFHRIVTKLGFFMTCLHLYHARLQIISVTGSSQILSWDHFGAADIVPGNGAVAFICYALMVASALKVIRDSKYEIFLIIHYLWLVGILFNMMHFKRGSWDQLGFLPGLALQMVDKFYLVFASTYNATLQNIAESTEAVRLEVGVVSLTVQLKENYSSMNYFGGWKWIAKVLSMYDPRPYVHSDPEYDCFHGGLGQYYFVNVPSISVLEWHPFSVSNIVENEDPANPSGAVGFHIKAMGPGTFSSTLAAKAQSGPVAIDVKLRGPYGSLSLNIFLYSHIVIIAGGIGITPMLPILDRIRYWCKVDKMKKCPNLRAVTIVWVA